MRPKSAHRHEDQRRVSVRCAVCGITRGGKSCGDSQVTSVESRGVGCIVGERYEDSSIISLSMIL